MAHPTLSSAASAPGAGPLQDPPLEEFSLLFRLFDGNGDGAITAAEAEEALAWLAGCVTPGAGETLLARARQNGRVDAAEFAAWAAGQEGFDLARNLAELFALIDRDGSGALCGEEVRVMLEILDASPGEDRLADLMRRHDLDGNGSIDYGEFLELLVHSGDLAISMPHIKRLKKTLVHYSSAARSTRIGLIEVDCDLGAGIPGAGSGIDLLKQAASRQQALRRISDSLIEEIETHLRPRAHAAEVGHAAERTPHARHIHTISRVMGETAGLVDDLRRRGLFPVVLGGDHSTAAGTIAGLRRAHPESRLGVVWIDAHADLHSPYTTPSGNMHGMPLAVAAAHDNHHHGINAPDPDTCALWEHCKALAGGTGAAIALHDLVYVAVRDIEPAEEATIEAHGIPIVTTEEVRRIGPERAAAYCLDHLASCDLIYVSFDVDSMDATICKGTGTPVHGGLWAEEAVRINRALLADPRVCCWEICEINPHLDTLNSLAEISLGVFQGVLEVLEQRLGVPVP